MVFDTNKVERKYACLQDKLRFSDQGLVLRESRLCTPKKLQRTVVDLAHKNHLGIEKTKRLLRREVLSQERTSKVERYSLYPMSGEVNQQANPITSQNFQETPKTV